MSSQLRRARMRFGRVSIFRHHGAWWLYFREGTKPQRRLVGDNQLSAEIEASLLNAQLVATRARLCIRQIIHERFGWPGAATTAGSSPDLATPSSRPAASVSLSDLRRQFLDYHERTVCSSLATVSRYRAATSHLEKFARQGNVTTGEIEYLRFVGHLRSIEIAPNGHVNTARRRLRDKGIKYILECCRSMYRFGIRHGILPRDFHNPFSDVELGKFRVRDAKPIFVFNAEDELKFFRAASSWAFPIHFTLAKTGLRPAEVVHVLVEDIDLEEGWLDVRSKPELGWTTKTARERRVPLIDQVVHVLRCVIGNRSSGAAFLRFKAKSSNRAILSGNRAALAEIGQRRLELARKDCGRQLNRREEARLLQSVWRDMGAIPVDLIRQSFIRAAQVAGLNATCPKSWRHTFATLLQQARVDVLVRQETLGHKPSSPDASVLGMTGVYTHTTPELHRAEIERALCLRPASLILADEFVLNNQTNSKEAGHVL